MIPIFTHPFALLAAVTIPALVAVYFLRNRHKNKPVSSLMLWAGLSRLQEGGVVLKRLQLPWLFLLELLVLLFLLLAALDPRFPTRDRLRPLLIVLDDSASMTAHVAGLTGERSVRDLARDEIQKAIRSTPFQSIRLILAGTQPTLLERAMTTSAEVERALAAGWSCRAPDADLTAAVALAQEMAGSDALILVVTDHAPAGDLQKGQVRWIGVGKPSDNLGFTGVGRNVSEQSDRCGVEVGNFSHTAATAQLGIVYRLGDKTRQDQKTLHIGAGMTERVVVEAPRGAGDIEFSLGDDALAADNRILALRPETPAVSVNVRVTDPAMAGWINRAVAASGLAVTQGIALVSPQLVFESEDHAADELKGDTWQCVIHAPTNATAFVGPFVTESSHPLVDGLSFDGLVWGAAGDLVLPGAPVLMAGNVTLITEEEPVPGLYRVHLQLQPSVSTVQHTPMWPSLIYNLLQWRATGRQGRFDPNARVGQQVSVPLEPAVHEVQLARPDGVASLVAAGRGQIAVELEQEGVYEIRTKANPPKRVVANFIAPGESDLRKRETGDWGSWRSAERIERDYVSSAWLWLLAALVMLVAHRVVMGSSSGAATTGRGLERERDGSSRLQKGPTP